MDPYHDAEGAAPRKVGANELQHDAGGLHVTVDRMVAETGAATDPVWPGRGAVNRGGIAAWEAFAAGPHGATLRRARESSHHVDLVRRGVQQECHRASASSHCSSFRSARAPRWSSSTGLRCARPQRCAGPTPSWCTFFFKMKHQCCRWCNSLKSRS